MNIVLFVYFFCLFYLLPCEGAVCYITGKKNTWSVNLEREKKMHSTTLWVITLCITFRAHNQLHPSTLGVSKPRDAVEDDDDITHANTEFEQSHS